MQRVIKMRVGKLTRRWCLILCAGVLCAAATQAQRARPAVADEAEFGPVVRTYLGYLKSEQEVVDDRVSRREVSQTYYRRNSNRIRALREMALRIARETKNDFLPELYAVTRDELGTLFDPLPGPESFRAGEVVDNTFRYLATVRAAEPFYLFARLDIYEQAEILQQKQASAPQPSTTAAAPDTTTGNASRGTRPMRPRRVHIP